jgi:3D-(3,5/4)-trihydroxycyclohexane-1,2-dione acylhydrolase (decyclizing)
VAAVDTAKHAGVAVVADARAALEALTAALAGWQVPGGHRELAGRLAAEWDATVQHAYDLGHGPLPAQSEVIGAVNTGTGPRDVVVCAAGSMPGDLHKLWRTRDPKGYHVEYGYSCMGYEIAGGVGVALAIRDTGDTDRRAVVLVGDGSYLMMAQELVTAVAEGIKLTVVLVQNHGYASIGSLSESVGSQRFGTKYRYRGTDEVLPVDLAANAASLGARALYSSTIEEFESALRRAVASDRTTVVQIETDPLVPAPDSEAWWDVPVAEVAALESTRAAREAYERDKATQKTYLKTPETVRTLP